MDKELTWAAFAALAAKDLTDDITTYPVVRWRPLTTKMAHALTFTDRGGTLRPWPVPVKPFGEQLATVIAALHRAVLGETFGVLDDSQQQDDDGEDEEHK